MASGIGKLPKGHNSKERYYILHMKKGADFLTLAIYAIAEKYQKVNA